MSTRNQVGGTCGAWQRLFGLLVCLVPGSLLAQTTLWNEDRVNWTPPTQCSDGSALTNCPISGYTVETATTATASTWSTLATVSASSTWYLATNLAAGNHCYRVKANSATGSSIPSNVDCAVATAPVPGPPVITIATAGYAVKPSDTVLAYVLDGQVGTVALGVPCDENRSMNQAGEYYAVNRQLYVTWTTNRRPNTVVVQCKST